MLHMIHKKRSNDCTITVMMMIMVLTMIVSTSNAFHIQKTVRSSDRTFRTITTPSSAELPVLCSSLSSVDDTVSNDNAPSATTTTTTTPEETIQEIKNRLVKFCTPSSSSSSSALPLKPLPSNVLSIVQELERASVETGIGQDSSISGMLSGEWRLLYSSTDTTRSSPFFWAFRKAFPNDANTIYDITDSIPAPLKEVGPAYQQIELNGGTSETGRFVSRVKITTLNGLASSIMTTRGTITGFDGTNGIKIRIDTTKAERSTAITTVFGPLGDVINENIPPFPSGDVLEQFVRGSSEVTLRTTYCDDTLRISRNNDLYDQEFFIWQRTSFANYDFI